MEKFALVDLKYGGKSLRCLERGETYHPGTGPAVEARLLHVEQQKIKARAAELKRFTIWDVGLGAAANALSAVEALWDSSSAIEIHSFDKTLAPLKFAIEHATELQYLLPHLKILKELVSNGRVRVGTNIEWTLHLGDFRETMLGGYRAPDSIFYDPYSPRGNQEMWTLEHFTKLFHLLDPNRNCILTNYTRSTSVRVTLLRAGFFVGVGSVIGEKAETTIASNRLELLDLPLRKDWLKRVKASRNAAPMRNATYGLSPISEEDLEWLRQRSQFQS